MASIFDVAIAKICRKDACNILMRTSSYTSQNIIRLFSILLYQKKSISGRLF